MHVEKKRIFVGNLPPCITENEIKDQFSQYGNVVNVDIKQRKDNLNETISPVFAFVSIEIDNKNLQTCFQEISNYEWQGYYVKLELAKESFLERLKREREELANKSKDVNTVIPKKDEPITYKPPVKIENENKKIYKSSSSESEESDTDCAKTVSSNNVTNKNKSSSSSSSDSETDDNTNSLQETSDLVIKNNKNKYLTNGKLKIESVNSTPIHIINPKESNLKKNSKTITPADEKRLKSLTQMKESYNQQKSLIRNALSKIDAKPLNKITFDDNGQSQENRNKRKLNTSANDSINPKKGKLALFGEDADEEDNINFEIKNQFEGRKGQKLLELQSRFTNDKRFTLDSRFVDDENETEELDLVEDDEKQKQREILESVLGKKIRGPPLNNEINNKKVPKGMLRFDPSKPEHSKFEIKEKQNIEHQTNEVNEDVEETQQNNEPVVEVSKEKFYKVTDNLKQSLKQNEGFSLLSMFGTAEEKDDKTDNDVAQDIEKSKFSLNNNPFKYDSSDSENEDEKTSKNLNKTQSNNYTDRKNVVSRPLWGEKFFFQIDDDRLKDGLNFLKKFNSKAKSEKFSETRREIKQIIRAKVKNVQRNNRPFRNKLGKHKYIKIKKAKKI